MRIKGCVKSDATYTACDLRRYREFGYVTKNGVVYNFGLCSAGGMYDLIREPHHTGTDIYIAAMALRNAQDVVGPIRICSLKD